VRRQRRAPVAAALLLSVAAALVGAVAPKSASAGIPGADCTPFARHPCLLPFPDDRLTRVDRSAPTGLRVDLPAGAMPAAAGGRRIAVGEYNRGDGFSPGSTLIVHVPGLDNARAFARTGAVDLGDMARAFSRRQPVVVVDESTGRRALIWSELDVTAGSAPATDLIIHPGRNFLEGHTYAVALRFLRTASGRAIAAPRWFALLRDGRPLPRSERAQQARYARIFAVLARAGIARSSLYEAWDFTVASRRSLTGRLLAIRNDAFAQLGDTELADGVPEGRAPAFTVTSAGALAPGLRDVQGTFSVPCYLVVCGASATTGFHYSSHGPDALPTQIPGNVASAPFECIVPSSATPAAPARISLYGHGFLGTHAEVERAWVQQLAAGYDMVFCSTDWLGLATPDKPYDVAAMFDLNRFPAMVDRIQQGVLNTLYLGRLMLNPRGLASDPAFEDGGRPVIDTSHLYYDGNSDGGILGGITTAVSPDFRRAVLGVTGISFPNMLIPRTTGIGSFGSIVDRTYRDRSLDPVILDLMQQLWDRGDPDGYAQQMTSDPLPDTPPHAVLMQIAYGDFQVTMYAATQEARTIGAFACEPALDLRTDRVQDRNLMYGIPAVPGYPFDGSAIEIWDSGPGHNRAPPLADVPPTASATNVDPHEDPRYTPAAQQQVSSFLEPAGAVIDVCGALPCRAGAYLP
jgi:hypothetical protein